MIIEIIQLSRFKCQMSDAHAEKKKILLVMYLSFSCQEQDRHAEGRIETLGRLQLWLKCEATGS